MNIKPYLLAAIAAVALAQPATAFEPDPPTRKVFVGDLDLLSASGQATMQKRVKAAAKRVCGWGFFSPYRNVNACIAKASAEAGPQMELAVASARARAQNQLAAR